MNRWQGLALVIALTQIAASVRALTRAVEQRTRADARRRMGFVPAWYHAEDCPGRRQYQAPCSCTLPNMPKGI